VAIFLATVLSFYFEQQADKEFKILNQVNDDIYYKVIRNERITQVLKKDIVVGDIVIIETGEEVPADGELLEAPASLRGDVIDHLSFELGGELLREAQRTHLCGSYLDEANGVSTLLFGSLTRGRGGAAGEEPSTQEGKAQGLNGLLRDHLLILFL